MPRLQTGRPARVPGADSHDRGEHDGGGDREATEPPAEPPPDGRAEWHWAGSYGGRGLPETKRAPSPGPSRAVVSIGYFFCTHPESAFDHSH